MLPRPAYRPAPRPSAGPRFRPHHDRVRRDRAWAPLGLGVSGRQPQLSTGARRLGRVEPGRRQVLGHAPAITAGPNSAQHRPSRATSTAAVPPDTRIARRSTTTPTDSCIYARPTPERARAEAAAAATGPARGCAAGRSTACRSPGRTSSDTAAPEGGSALLRDAAARSRRGGARRRRPRRSCPRQDTPEPSWPSRLLGSTR